MYEPLRERGWFLIDNVHAAYPGFIALSPEGERMPVARAFRVAGQRTPKCFLRSWLR